MQNLDVMIAPTVGEPAERARPAGRRRRAAALGVACLGPLLVVAICACRAPAALMRGHLWAEDAFFLTHMLADRRLPSQLLFVYNGHLELLNNIVFAAASHLKLKLVPLATSLSGLAIECALAFVVVAFRRDLELRLGAALLVALLVVVSPLAAENQLNMLNSVWVTAAILLVMINLPAARLAGHLPAVGVATLLLGLSGMPATCLMPVAALYAVAWRSRPHLVIAAVLALCGLVQGALVVTHGAEHRFGSVSPWVYLAAPYFHVVVEHLAGIEGASALDHFFAQLMPDPSASLSLMLAPLALLAWILVHIARSDDMRSRLLLATFVYVVVFDVTFAIGDRSALFSIYDMRYFFVPFVALALLIGRAGSGSSRWPPRFALGLMVFATVLSAKDFFLDGYNGMYVDPERDWRREVERCAAQTGPCRIAVDPGGYYAVDVPASALR